VALHRNAFNCIVVNLGANSIFKKYRHRGLLFGPFIFQSLFARSRDDLPVDKNNQLPEIPVCRLDLGKVLPRTGGKRFPNPSAILGVGRLPVSRCYFLRESLSNFGACPAVERPQIF
jgi:hypothetical protein